VDSPGGVKCLLIQGDQIYVGGGIQSREPALWTTGHGQDSSDDCPIRQSFSYCRCLESEWRVGFVGFVGLLRQRADGLDAAWEVVESLEEGSQRYHAIAGWIKNAIDQDVVLAAKAFRILADATSTPRSMAVLLFGCSTICHVFLRAWTFHWWRRTRSAILPRTLKLFAPSWSPSVSHSRLSGR
jgi:hypothetical protein